MRAAVLESHGGPDSVRLRRIDPPAPTADEVLVEVAACGMCGHDQADRKGLTKAALPVVLGHEVAGTVTAVGSRVRRFAVGDRVARKQYTTCGNCAACWSGRELECAQRVFGYGGFAEFVTVQESSLLPVPDGVDLAAAAVVACAVGSCLQALGPIGRVRPGETVVVTGAGGGLGLHGVQVAAALGAEVVALTGSAAKAETLAGLGAAHVVIADGGTWWPQILEMTDGRGADVVLDNVGHPSLFTPCFRALARRGRYVLTGQVSGEPVRLHPAFVFAKEAVITGSASTSMATFVDAMAMVGDGRVTPVVERYPLDDATAAFADLDARRVTGRIVLVPGGSGDPT